MTCAAWRIFAERAGCLAVWQQMLEEGDMWKSQVLENVRAETRINERQDTILRLLRKRFGVEPPSELVMRVEGTTDLDTLSTWFDLAVQVDSLETFLARTSGPGSGALTE